MYVNTRIMCIQFKCLGDSKDTKRFTHIGVKVIQAAAQLPGVRGEAW